MTAANSALRTPQSALPNRPSGWLPADRVAEILGRSKSSVYLMCRVGRLRAAKIEAEGGRWFVDPASAPELRIATGTVGPTLSAGPIAGLSNSKRTRAHARFEAVQEYLAAEHRRPASLTVREFRRRWVAGVLAHSPDRRLSVRGLERWIAAWQAGGAAALVDGSCAPNRETISAAAWEFMQGLWLREQRLTVRQCYDTALILAAEKGWRLPGFRSVQKRFQKLDRKLAWAGREPKRFEDRALPYITRDWSRTPAMGLWVADHRQMDFLVPRPLEVAGRLRLSHDRPRAGIAWSWHRPWLTCYLDARSWYPVAWALEFDGPDGDRTMGTFVQGVRAHGLPAHVYLDNGKDFRMVRYSGGRPRRDGRSKIVEEGAVRPLLEMLGVGVTFAEPYNAKAKIIEPWFRLVADRFDRLMDTYCGRRSDLRPEAAEKLQRLKGSAQAWAENGFTLDRVRDQFARWVEDVYAAGECPAAASKGRSVRDAFRDLRSADFVERRPDDASLAMVLLPSRKVSVHANGVPVTVFGQWKAWYWSEDLVAYTANSRRKVVYRYNPLDPSAIYVFDAASGEFVAKATPRSECPGLAEAGSDDADEIGRQIGMRRRIRRDIKEEVRGLRSFADAILDVSARLRPTGYAGAGPQGEVHPPGRARIMIAMADAGLARAGQALRLHERLPKPAAAPTAAERLAATGTDHASPDEARHASSVLDRLIQEQESLDGPIASA